MKCKIETDFDEMELKMKCYVEKGRVAGSAKVPEEPLISVKPDASLIKPLKKTSTYDGCFVAVDCSTRTLKRANNWGIYLMRASSAAVRGRTVDWGTQRGYALLWEMPMYVGVTCKISELN